MYSNTEKLFVAFFASSDWQQKIEKLKNAFPLVRGMKWVPGKNIHLTVFFMGEVTGTKIDSLRAELREVALKNKPFELVFDGFTAAPPDRPSTMLWAKFKPSGEFNLLARDLKKALMSVTILDEEHRIPTPHLTIARYKEGTNIGELNISMKDPIFKANEMILVHADLRHDDADYKIIERYKLSSQRPLLSEKEAY